MQEKFAEITTLTILITTIVLLALGGLVVYFLFAYQRKRYRHQQELLEVRESFNKTLLESKLEIQEQTLGHIAKELHANFSHLVSVININLSTLSVQKPEEWNEKVLETKSLAKQLMSELKALSVSLNTEHIMHIGFLKALENELSRLDKTKQYKVIFTKIGQEYKLSPEKEIILFRMCQEILNNIVKHAEAKTIDVVLDYTPGLFRMSIKDDGIGFATDEVQIKSYSNGSTGLRNIYNRAKLINADVDIVSDAGKGTSADIKLQSNNQQE